MWEGVERGLHAPVSITEARKPETLHLLEHWKHATHTLSTPPSSEGKTRSTLVLQVFKITLDECECGCPCYVPRGCSAPGCLPLPHTQVGTALGTSAFHHVWKCLSNACARHVPPLSTPYNQPQTHQWFSFYSDILSDFSLNWSVLRVWDRLE